jgi:hypothetical protein
MHGCNGLVGQDGKILPLHGSWGDVLSREGYIVLLPIRTALAAIEAFAQCHSTNGPCNLTVSARATLTVH